MRSKADSMRRPSRLNVRSHLGTGGGQAARPGDSSRTHAGRSDGRCGATVTGSFLPLRLANYRRACTTRVGIGRAVPRHLAEPGRHARQGGTAIPSSRRWDQSGIGSQIGGREVAAGARPNSGAVGAEGLHGRARRPGLASSPCGRTRPRAAGSQPRGAVTMKHPSRSRPRHANAASSGALCRP
jgi:hypothetical protein